MMIEEISSYIMNKDLKRYAWTLYSGLADGTVTMTDLISVILHCWQKEVSFSEDEEDDELYFSNAFLYGDCGCFAAALFRRGILTGQWTFADGIFAQDGQTVSLDEINQFYKTIEQQSPEYVNEFMVNWFKVFDDFNRDMEAFQLAVLEHCTEETIVAAFIMIEYFAQGRIRTIEELKSWDRTEPKYSDLDQFIEYLEARTWQMHAYDYLESTYPNVDDELDSANARLRRAKTYAEAVFAAIEYEFWLEVTVTLPCTAYLLLTGQMDGTNFPRL